MVRLFREGLQQRLIPIGEAFQKLDENGDGFLSYAEFAEGIDQFITLSQPIKEKLFATMDINQIGLLNY